MSEIDLTQTVLGAINRLDTKIDTRFEAMQVSLGEMKDHSAKLSERVGAVEVWRDTQDRNADRWWAQTWPNHEKVVQLLEDRLRITEHSKATQEKLDKIEVRLHNYEEVTAKLSVVGGKVAELEIFKVRTGVIIALVSFFGTGLFTLALKLIFP